MKRFLSGILIFVTVFNIYALTSESVSATAPLVMTYILQQRVRLYAFIGRF